MFAASRKPVDIATAMAGYVLSEHYPNSLTIPHIERIVDEVYAASRGKPYQEVTWIPLEE